MVYSLPLLIDGHFLIPVQSKQLIFKNITLSINLLQAQINFHSPREADTGWRKAELEHSPIVFGMEQRIRDSEW